MVFINTENIHKSKQYLLMKIAYVFFTGLSGLSLHTNTVLVFCIYTS